jgi:hypothetical protein
MQVFFFHVEEFISVELILKVDVFRLGGFNLYKSLERFLPFFSEQVSPDMRLNLLRHLKTFRFSNGALLNHLDLVRVFHSA